MVDHMMLSNKHGEVVLHSRYLHSRSTRSETYKISDDLSQVFWLSVFILRVISMPKIYLLISLWRITLSRSDPFQEVSTPS